MGNMDRWSAEETIISARGLEKDGGWLNKIYSIIESRPIHAEAVAHGIDILKKNGLEDFLG